MPNIVCYTPPNSFTKHNQKHKKIGAMLYCTSSLIPCSVYPKPGVPEDCDVVSLVMKENELWVGTNNSQVLVLDSEVSFANI